MMNNLLGKNVFIFKMCASISGRTQEDGCKTIVSHVSIALEPLDNNLTRKPSLI